MITAVVVQNRPVAQVAAEYGVSRSWLYELIARYRHGGDAVFELREKLATTGLDFGPDTIRWHLEHHHQVTVSRATIWRYLTKAGLVVPETSCWPPSAQPLPCTGSQRPR